MLKDETKTVSDLMLDADCYQAAQRERAERLKRMMPSKLHEGRDYSIQAALMVIEALAD